MVGSAPRNEYKVFTWHASLGLQIHSIGNNYKKGLWTEEEDKILMDYVYVHGKGRWNRISKTTGLKRCGKSCRLRWINYLSPNVNRGDFTEEEEDLIIRLHNLLGNRWSLIAGRVPGRTDNQVKNHWNSHLSKKLRMKKDRENASDSSVSLPEEGQGENLKLQQEATSSNTDNPSPNGDCGSPGPKLKDSPERTGSGSYLLEDSQERTGSGLDLLEDIPERTGWGLDLLESLANDDLSSSFWFYNEDFYLNRTPGLVDFLYGNPLDVVWHNF